MNAALRVRFSVYAKRGLLRDWTNRRAIHRSILLAKDYPDHDLLPMPALSPTMEIGTISQWELKEGDSFSAGTVLCSVETDKATMDFESQDDGFIAKILREGSGAVDIPVGAPIAVVVEEEDDIDAFADYVLEGASPAAVEPAASAASAPDTPSSTPGVAREVSIEHVLLPSARFLAESKYVSLDMKYCRCFSF